MSAQRPNLPQIAIQPSTANTSGHLSFPDILPSPSLWMQTPMTAQPPLTPFRGNFQFAMNSPAFPADSNTNSIHPDTLSQKQSQQSELLPADSTRVEIPPKKRLRPLAVMNSEAAAGINPFPTITPSTDQALSIPENARQPTGVVPTDAGPGASNPNRRIPILAPLVSMPKKDSDPGNLSAPSIEAVDGKVISPVAADDSLDAYEVDPMISRAMRNRVAAMKSREKEKARVRALEAENEKLKEEINRVTMINDRLRKNLAKK
mmetsp:Transcript_8004/g.14518  ORF Transcript_8004/g.14518 Transcript_8004/m.14518 type:complete len:262 (-) Transcript_8004:560-1345(-)|eukprot:CAMPEP_0182442928 /NCGR_PEP_ID=MMETSP1172-20130603/1782_1 /TAXON_ID=708627 /ORGANISM="Timspurckia oligopyrenoides, Strain CCMP3278" /LENGTH=261 /DNA_ID=CAMNT_0024638023 /DNA_START=438 /DNA_END=1223 /DNA_ORIENTATION=-